MELTKSKNYEINYLAKVVDIKSFTKHPNPEVTKLKVAHVDGFNIIVGIDEKPGLFIYFPMLSEINPHILEYCNLYEKVELNKDNTKKGFFGSNGKVKGIKLKGLVSEGFLLPAEAFNNFCIDSFNKVPEFINNTEFDIINDNGKTVWVNRKFIVSRNTSMIEKRPKVRANVKRFNRLREDQFRFHYDTELIKKIPNAILPNDIIHISSKWHGTSAITAKILCHKKLSWKEKIAKWLTGNSFDTYDVIYSSRKVIKNKYYNKNVTNGFYSSDPWYYATEELKPFLINGMTLYYEIVGYLPDGKPIQKGYDYGCKPSTVNYELGTQYKIYIYRITMTNVDGIVTEFTPLQVAAWCKRNGLLGINTLYYGYAKDLYGNPSKEEQDSEDFNYTNWIIDHMANDKNFYMEELSPDCINKVPHEGIVIKKEGSWHSAMKLKCFAFLNKEQKELDKGETNIEDNQ